MCECSFTDKTDHSVMTMKSVEFWNPDSMEEYSTS